MRSELLLLRIGFTVNLLGWERTRLALSEREEYSALKMIQQVEHRWSASGT